jgi:hypothetical protein
VDLAMALVSSLVYAALAFMLIPSVRGALVPFAVSATRSG